MRSGRAMCGTASSRSQSRAGNGRFGANAENGIYTNQQWVPHSLTKLGIKGDLGGWIRVFGEDVQNSKAACLVGNAGYLGHR